ncbi:hypothetical protein QJS66_05315 [Kocuria rhizophila]|nr:hypothetical protein QJS66_05315 [Kocuria rhizophila]
MPSTTRGAPKIPRPWRRPRSWDGAVGADQPPSDPHPAGPGRRRRRRQHCGLFRLQEDWDASVWCSGARGPGARIPPGRRSRGRRADCGAVDAGAHLLLAHPCCAESPPWPRTVSGPRGPDLVEPSCALLLPPQPNSAASRVVGRADRGVRRRPERRHSAHCRTPPTPARGWAVSTAGRAGDPRELAERLARRVRPRCRTPGGG